MHFLFASLSVTRIRPLKAWSLKYSGGGGEVRIVVYLPKDSVFQKNWGYLFCTSQRDITPAIKKKFASWAKSVAQLESSLSKEEK